MDNYELFYDDFCPLCISTINFIKRFIKPRNTIYSPISLSNLIEKDKNLALSEMLLISPNGQKYLGYFTYRKLLILSSSSFRFFYKLLAIFMKFYLTKVIGQFIYKLVSANRRRCDDNCKI